VVDPIATTAITGGTEILNATIAYVATERLSFSMQNALLATTFASMRAAEFVEVESFIVTGEATPPSIDLTKYSELVKLTAFSDSGDYFEYMKPLDEMLTLPILDETKKIPILDVTGPEDKAVKLLISDPVNGELKLIGMEDPLKRNITTRSNRGPCNGGAIQVSFDESGEYEKDGEIKLLAPLPVQKAKGDAEKCPCFTSLDTDGGPSPPQDNSAIGGHNPCTLRVRRLQLRQCHT
jgi:hypothetical protein